MEHLFDWGREGLQLIALALVPVLATWAALASWRSRSVSRAQAATSASIDVLLLLSLVVIGVLGLRLGRGLPSGFEQWNLVPFRDLARSLDGRPWGLQPAVAGLLANLGLFVPFGIAFALRFRQRSWRTLLVLTAAISIGVELWQAVTATGRSSDVTDVVMNTAGGLTGFAMGRTLVDRARKRQVTPLAGPSRVDM
jgi:glycopeptide antibiotics resistance protein